MKRVREWIESIVFAGLKPSDGRTPAVPVPETRKGRLKERLERFISGGPAPTDPLYLTNRSRGQKLRAWSVVAVPLVILIGAVAFVLTQYAGPPQKKRQREISSKELASKMLPSLKDLKIESSRSIDVVEARIDRSSGVRMVGVVRNLTDHEIAGADISCDLTDAAGVQLGGATAQVGPIPAAGTKRFEVPLRQTEASAVLVREITAR